MTTPTIGAAVTVAYVHSTEVAYSWHQSMMDAFAYDLGGHARMARGGRLASRYGSGGIISARNKAAATFLDTKTAEWLWWIDTDMGFPADVVEQLVAAADPTERPIVGALAFMNRELEPNQTGGFHVMPAPTIFDWQVDHDGHEGFTVRWDYERDTLTRCWGTGSACILIHRSVLVRMRTEYGDTWYDPLRNPSTGELLSEDLSFCGRAAMLDIPVHVDTRAKTTHLKHLWLDETHYETNKPLIYRGAATPVEATVVIIPVYRRPANAAPFMASLTASTDKARALAVATEGDDDTITAWREAGADVLTVDAVPFAPKVNAGYRATDEPWLFVCGDDVAFHPGWLDQAQQLANVTGAHLVATNDQLNQAVRMGRHATHPLIRRTWIDTHGASWDGPGTVTHEGYRHWWVDNEWTAVARQAGVFAYAPLAVVEHLHPLAGKAAIDDVYELGQKQADADRALFEKRVAAHA